MYLLQKFYLLLRNYLRENSQIIKPQPELVGLFCLLFHTVMLYASVSFDMMGLFGNLVYLLSFKCLSCKFIFWHTYRLYQYSNVFKCCNCGINYPKNFKVKTKLVKQNKVKFLDINELYIDEYSFLEKKLN